MTDNPMCRVGVGSKENNSEAHSSSETEAESPGESANALSLGIEHHALRPGMLVRHHRRHHRHGKEGAAHGQGSDPRRTILRLPTSYFVPEVPAAVQNLTEGGDVPMRHILMTFYDADVESEFLSWFYAGSKIYWYVILLVPIAAVLLWSLITTDRKAQYGTAIGALIGIGGFAVWYFYLGLRLPCTERRPRDIARGHEMMVCAILVIGAGWTALVASDTQSRCINDDGAILDFARQPVNATESKFFCTHHVPPQALGGVMIPMILLQPRFAISAAYSILVGVCLLLSPAVRFDDRDAPPLTEYYMVVSLLMPILVLSAVMRYIDERGLRRQFVSIARLNHSVVELHRAKEARKHYVEELFPPLVRQKLFSSRIYDRDKSRDATVIMFDIADFPIWCTQRLPRDAAIIAAAVADIINQEALAVDITTVYSSGDVYCGCCNLLQSRKHHATRAAFLAIKAYSQLFILQMQFRAAVQLRCAINTGLLNGDVIGETHLRYSVFGPCYKVAVALLAACTPQQILASRAAHDSYGTHVEDRLLAMIEAPSLDAIESYEVINLANDVDVTALFKEATPVTGSNSSNAAHSRAQRDGVEDGGALSVPSDSTGLPVSNSPKGAFSLEGSATPHNVPGGDALLPPHIPIATEAEAETIQPAPKSSPSPTAGSPKEKSSGAAKVFIDLLGDPQSNGFEAIQRVADQFSTIGEPCCASFSGGSKCYRAFVAFNLRKDAIMLVLYFAFTTFYTAFVLALVEYEREEDDAQHAVKSSRDMKALRRLLFAVAIAANSFAALGALYNRYVASRIPARQLPPDGARNVGGGGSGAGDLGSSQSTNRVAAAIPPGSSPSQSIEAGSAAVPMPAEAFTSISSAGAGTSLATSSRVDRDPLARIPELRSVSPDTLRRGLLLGAIGHGVLLLAALGCSRPAIPSNGTLWLAPLILVGLMPLVDTTAVFTAATVLTYGISFATQVIDPAMPLVTEMYCMVDAIMGFMCVWMFTKRSRRSRDHFRYVRVQKAIAGMLVVEEAMRERVLQAMIPKAVQGAAQLGRFKNTLEVTSLNEVIVCAIRFDDFGVLHEARMARRSLKHQIAIFETALKMLCPPSIAVVKSLGDTLCIAGPLFTASEQQQPDANGALSTAQDAIVARETFNAGVALLRTLGFLRQKRVAFSAAVAFEMGFGVLSNAQFPSYDLLGVAAYSARSLLSAAPNSAVIVTSRLVQFMRNVDPVFGNQSSMPPLAFVSGSCSQHSGSASGSGSGRRGTNDGIAVLPSPFADASMPPSGGSGSGVGDAGAQGYPLQKESSGSTSSRDHYIVPTPVIEPPAAGASRSYASSIQAIVGELSDIADGGGSGGGHSHPTQAVFKALETWRIRGLGSVGVHQLAFREVQSAATSPTPATTSGGGGVPRGAAHSGTDSRNRPFVAL